MSQFDISCCIKITSDVELKVEAETMEEANLIADEFESEPGLFYDKYFSEIASNMSRIEVSVEDISPS